MQVNQCDRCGKIYNTEEDKQDVTLELRDLWQQSESLEKFDLCPKCSEEFDAWIQNVAN